MLLPVALLTGGCDFVRQVAGRPTGAQVEALRVERERAEEAAHQARLDSMKQLQQAMADSLAALEAYLLDSLSQTKGTMVSPGKLGGISASQLKSRYCIVVGAFRTKEFAERKRKACDDAGYAATIVTFRNGLMAVTVCQSNSLDQTLKTLKQLRGKGICPPDGWILINE